MSSEFGSPLRDPSHWISPVEGALRSVTSSVAQGFTPANVAGARGSVRPRAFDALRFSFSQPLLCHIASSAAANRLAGAPGSQSV